MVRDDIHRSCGTLEVMVPSPECFKDSKQFLVMSIIIQFQSHQSPGVKGDRTKLTISAGNRKYTSDGVVRGISLHSNRGIRNEVSEDGCGGEGMFEGIEGATTLFGEIPRSILLGELGQWDRDVGIIKDKLAEKFAKPRNDWISFTLQGSSQSGIVVILSRDIVKPSEDRW